MSETSSTSFILLSAVLLLGPCISSSLKLDSSNDTENNLLRTRVQNHFMLMNENDNLSDPQIYYSSSDESNDISILMAAQDQDDDDDGMREFTMLYTMNTIAYAFLGILYGQSIDNEIRDRSIYYQLDTSDLEAISDEIKASDEGYEESACQTKETTVNVFYEYLLASVRAVLEIRFNKQLSKKGLKIIRSYFNSKRMHDLWQYYESETGSKTINLCGGDGSGGGGGHGGKYPYTSYVVNVDRNTRLRDARTCQNSPKPDRSNGNRLAGNGAFHFDVKFTNRNAGKDYYMAMAIGKNSKRRSGQYFAYYGAWGYCGYQPIGLQDGKQKLQLIYSSFDARASVVDSENCFSGADNQPNGVTCRIQYHFIEYDKLYYIRSVYDESTRIFTGYFIDPYNDRVVQIGSFKYSSDPCWQETSSNGFLESYGDNTFKSCCDLDSMDIFVVCPFGEGISCSGGYASEYGTTCAGQYADMYSKVVDDFSMIVDGYKEYPVQGLYIHRGWKYART